MNLDDLEENEKFRALCDRAVLAKYGAAYKWHLSGLLLDGQDTTATLVVTVPASVRTGYRVQGDARGWVPHGYRAVTYSTCLYTDFLPVPTQEFLTVSFQLPFTE